MKKNKFIAWIVILISTLCTSFLLAQWMNLGNTDTILNTDSNNAVNTDNGNWTIWDPIREWAYHLINDWEEYQIGWIISNDEQITNHDDAMNNTLNIITRIINYALWLASLIALIYLLVHWFIMVTAAWNDWQYKKWLKWIKFAVIALGGIGLSWFIVSFIFWIIENITS